jgi:hypothetical protein
MVVPFERFAEMMDAYRRGFASRGLDFAVWGHISDGNVHPNVIPRSYEDVVRGKDAILEFGREVARLGGCPLAEHGVGPQPGQAGAAAPVVRRRGDRPDARSQARARPRVEARAGRDLRGWNAAMTAAFLPSSFILHRFFSALHRLPAAVHRNP